MKRMLVCLDGSGLSRSILPIARGIAKRGDFEAVLLRGLEPAPYAIPAAAGLAFMGPEPRDPDATSHTRDQIHDELAAELRDFPNGGTSLVPDADDPSRMIVAAARAEGVDFIAMATHSRRPIGELLFGGVAHGVVRSGVTPVILFHPSDSHDAAAWPQGDRPIMVVCLDGSHFSRSILPAAENLARAMDAETHLIRVLDDSKIKATVLHHRRAGAVPGFRQTLDDEHRDFRSDAGHDHVIEPRMQAVDRVGRTAHLELDADLEGFPDNAQASVLHGEEPAKLITDYLRDVNADLVAMATHSRRPMTEIIAGSVTDAVVRSGIAPALVLHPADR